MARLARQIPQTGAARLLLQRLQSAQTTKALAIDQRNSKQVGYKPKHPRGRSIPNNTRCCLKLHVQRTVVQVELPIRHVWRSSAWVHGSLLLACTGKGSHSIHCAARRCSRHVHSFSSLNHFAGTSMGRMLQVRKGIAMHRYHIPIVAKCFGCLGAIAWRECCKFHKTQDSW